MRSFPSRGFPTAEYEQRTVNTQYLMHEEHLDAILVMTEPEVRYYTGFLTQFWESPTRPWFVVVPLEGKPIAVVPEIGAAGMRNTWLEDVRTWSSPHPADDGVSMLAGTLDTLPVRYGRIGVPMGAQTQLRMPVSDFLILKTRLGSRDIVDAAKLVHRVRAVKSEGEIEKIHTACEIASDAFESLPSKISMGLTERDICRTFKVELLKIGADSAPYVMGVSGHEGYNDIIMGPTDRVIGEGDVMIIDTGATFDGYYCDFDRNYAFGRAPDEVKKAYQTVYEATEAGFEAARPGATTTDLWRAMWKVLEAGGALGNGVGRMGHGLGMQLTEQPSNMPGDDTTLEPGMVLTLEPGMVYAPNRWMVHEENIVIRPDGPQWLSRRAWPEIPVV